MKIPTHVLSEIIGTEWRIGRGSEGGRDEIA